MSYEKQFKDSMEALGKMHERSKVYVDFMDYYIYQNSKSPDRKLPSGYKESEMQFIGPHLGRKSENEKLKENMFELIPDFIPQLEHVPQQSPPQYVQSIGVDYNMLKDITRLELRIEQLEERIKQLEGGYR